MHQLRINEVSDLGRDLGVKRVSRPALSLVLATRQTRVCVREFVSRMMNKEKRLSLCVLQLESVRANQKEQLPGIQSEPNPSFRQLAN